MVKERENKVFWMIFGVFVLLLVLYAIFSLKTGYHDAGEYITFTKEIAGVGNVGVYSTHSVVYPVFLSFFVKLFPYLQTIKIVNVLLLALIGLFLFKLFKDKKAFLIWVFSPLVWFIGMEVSPILLVSFFVTLGYYFFKKWEDVDKKIYLFLVGLFFGIGPALWLPAMFFVVLFVLFFLWKKKFNEFFVFLIGFGIAFSTRFVVDYFVFGFPFVSIMRYVGATIIVHLGLGNNNYSAITWRLLLRVLFFIAPLSFFVYKIDFKKYWKEMVLLGICCVFFFFRGAQPNGIKLFLPFAPIWILMLSQALNWKKVFINSLIGFVIILFLIVPIFTDSYQKDMEMDVKQFYDEYSFEEVLTGKEQALVFATNSWAEKPYFLWWKEYELQKQGELDYSSYSYFIKPNINQLKILYMQMGLRKMKDRSFEGIPLITTNRDAEYSDFEFVKSYRTFDFYMPKDSI